MNPADAGVRRVPCSPAPAQILIGRPGSCPVPTGFRAGWVVIARLFPKTVHPPPAVLVPGAAGQVAGRHRNRLASVHISFDKPRWHPADLLWPQENWPN